jgi:hypothetical protein
MPPLTGPGGARRMLPNRFGTVTGLPPDNAIYRDVLFEMPPSISKEQADAAVAEPDHGNDMDTTLTDLTIGRGAVSVLESIFGDQSTARDGVTDTNIHRQQQSIIDGRQQQQETADSMEQQEDTTPLRRTTPSGTPFSPPRLGNDTSLVAILKNVEENNESFTSGSVYHHGDDDVDDDEDVALRNPIELRIRYVGAPGDSHNNTLDIGRGRGRGGRGRGVATGHGRGCGAGVPVQVEDYTGLQVAFPPDTAVEE